MGKYAHSNKSQILQSEMSFIESLKQEESNLCKAALKSGSVSNNNLVLYESREKISNIILNRPDKLNAVSEQLLVELENCFRKAKDDDQTRVVILKGNGRAFCVGASLEGHSSLEENEEYWREKFQSQVRLFKMILNLPKPVIGVVHGYVLGFGFWLMNSCDMVFSAEDCKFGIPEVRQASSAVRMINPYNVRRNRVYELLTGDFVDAETAHSMGFVNHVFPRAELDKQVQRFTKKLSLIDSFALSMNKQAINAWYSIGDFERILNYQVENGVKLYTSESSKKWSDLRSELGLKAFLEKRDNPFKMIDQES